MKLSLCGWSLNRLFRREASPLTLLEFPAFTLDQFGIDAVELNNIYFESTEPAYLDMLRAAADAAGSTMLNIAVDEKGDLASDDEALRLDRG
ncbi:MAG: sugar phosphate isomerase/epimerase, partial [Proteobacteria bacterium]